MGWLYTPGISRRYLIKQRTSGWQHESGEGMAVNSVCLAHCYRGGVFSGVLWTVWERTFEKDGKEAQPIQRWIGCDLMQYSREDDGWGYKDMDESMHPYFYSCPLKYLRMVPVVTCQEWREIVHEHHAKLKRKREARKLAKAGA